jgi:Protein of unknown function (DUF2905)
MAPLGRLMMLMGVVLFTIGAAVWALASFTALGRLPGDLVIRRGNFTFYFPIATCVLLSILLTLVLSFWSRR